MTTVHEYNVPPVLPPEVYLEPDQLSKGTLYALDSGYIERVGYCVDGENFLGIHIEDRPGAFALRLTREGHRSLQDAHGVSMGARPLHPVRTLSVDPNYELGDLAQLLIRENLSYYEAIQQGDITSSLSPEEVAIKQQLFAAITASLIAKTLRPPDEHGYLDLSILRAT